MMPSRNGKPQFGKTQGATMTKIILPTVFAMAVVGLFASVPAFASFDGEKHRSINGTSETLRQGNAELGLASFSYGITNELMLTVPTLPLVVGQVAAGARYKVNLNSNLRISPEAYVGTYANSDLVYGNVGATVGVDLPHSKNTLDFAFNVTRMRDTNWDDAFDSKSSNENSNSVSVTQATGRVEFNHYTNGSNLFYVGVDSSALLYGGFTWAWENVHVGLLSSAPTLFFPLPYIYVRF
jgi:hypothetical protein